jgi:ATP-dependent Clp protease ATP-binding subunit ClpB
VVLFDEIEKAHTDVFNTLLQILDDGRLTDGHGRTVDFKNTVVTMTSNLGSHLFSEPGLADTDEVRHRVMETLRAQFRPEFLNRIDEVIIFHSLDREQIKEIVDIQMRGLKQRLDGRHMSFELTEAAKELVVEQGYDPTYGARPLKRTIQRRILDPLALRVLDGTFPDGSRIVVDARDGEIVFRQEDEEQEHKQKPSHRKTARPG